MAGKNCTGIQSNNAGNLKNSRAYCEGAKYRAEGTLLTRPPADNPHEVDSEAYDAWDRGWIYAENRSGSYVSSFGCCPSLGNVIA